jgi:hypothetical protein
VFVAVAVAVGLGSGVFVLVAVAVGVIVGVAVEVGVAVGGKDVTVAGREVFVAVGSSTDSVTAGAGFTEHAVRNPRITRMNNRYNWGWYAFFIVCSYFLSVEKGGIISPIIQNTGERSVITSKQEFANWSPLENLWNTPVDLVWIRFLLSQHVVGIRGEKRSLSTSWLPMWSNPLRCRQSEQVIAINRSIEICHTISHGRSLGKGGTF